MSRNSAFVHRPRPGPGEPAARRFEGETADTLAAAFAFLEARPVARLTVLCDHSLLVERVLFLPRLGRKKISLMIPGEISALVPGPLGNYLGAFTVPGRPGRPVTVRLLPLKIRAAVAAAFPGTRLDFLPLDAVLPRVSGEKGRPSLVLVGEPDGARLVFCEDGEALAGRSFRFSGSGDEAETVAREAAILARQVRAPEGLAIARFKGWEESGPLFSGRLPGPRFAPLVEGDLSRARLVMPALLAAGVLALGLVFHHAYREREEARARYESAGRFLAEAAAGPVSAAEREFLEILSRPGVARLFDGRFSPLEGFLQFHRAVPDEVPLVVEYLEIDRERMILRGRVDSPRQVETLARRLQGSGFFAEPVLGELQVEAGRVSFPLTAARVRPADEAGPEGGR